MFIIIQTNTHVSSIKSILKMLQHFNINFIPLNTCISWYNNKHFLIKMHGTNIKITFEICH